MTAGLDNIWGQGSSSWMDTPTGQGGYDYYDPWSSYGGDQYGFTNPYGDNPFWDSAVGEQYLNSNPNAAWGVYAYPMLEGGGNSAFDEWMMQQRTKAYSGYEAALASNPNLGYLSEYLPSLGSGEDWQRRFQMLSPQDRGEQYGATSAQARTIPRL